MTTPAPKTARGATLRVGDVLVCGTCLRTTFQRSETAARRCPCGGRIIAMPGVEVEARRRDRR